MSWCCRKVSQHCACALGRRVASSVEYLIRLLLVHSNIHLRSTVHILPLTCSKLSFEILRCISSCVCGCDVMAGFKIIVHSLPSIQMQALRLLQSLPVISVMCLEYSQCNDTKVC